MSYFSREEIQRPHSTTTLNQRNQQQYYHHLNNSYNHSWSASTSKHPPHRSSIPKDRFTSGSHRPLVNNKRLAISSPPPPSSSPLCAPHLTPPSPVIRPSWLMASTLTRTNSLPGKTHRPITHRSITISARLTPTPSSIVKRTRTSHTPPLSRLPTSPMPASAVTGASGLTVSGRMVEYESDHCRREALSKVLRAVSQSSTGRSRYHHTSSGRFSPSQTVSSGGENEQGSPSSAMIPSRRQEGMRRAQRPATRKPSLAMPTSAPCAISRATNEPPDEGFPFGFVDQSLCPPPGSQASGYISFASLNLFAPPSPPESTTGFLADDEQEIIHNSGLIECPLRLRLPPHNPSHILNHSHLKT